MNHKTDMREALQLCIDAMLHDGVPTDPYHPRRVALAAAENALASRPDAQESLASENVVKDSVHKVSQERAQADARGEQDCPHGVDDGACKQCYVEAVEAKQRAIIQERFAKRRSTGPTADFDLPAPNDSITAARDRALAAIAAIEYALRADEGLVFLECWLHGQFDIIRNEWPNAPDAIIPDSASAPTLGEIDWREKFFVEQRARMELEAALHLVVEDKPQPQAAEPKGLTADEYTRKFEALCGAWCVNEAERKTAKLFWFEARALLANGE